MTSSELLEKAPGPFLIATGEFEVNGTLIFEFEKLPREDKAYHVILTKKGLKGTFNAVIRMAEEKLSDKLIDECFKIGIAWTKRTATDFNVAFKTENVCLELIEAHPIRTAAIVLSVLVVLFVGIWLWLVWRKRKYERSKRSILASKIDIESNDMELEMTEVRKKRKKKKKEETNKMFRFKKEMRDMHMQQS